jgi:hypothetical protein
MSVAPTPDRTTSSCPARATDVIREVIRRDDVIELRCREVLVRPCLPAKSTLTSAPPSSTRSCAGCSWSTPGRAVAVVHAAHRAESSAVGRLHEHVVRVDDIRVLRVGVNFVVHARAGADCDRVRALPRLAAVVGAEYAARIGLDVRQTRFEFPPDTVCRCSPDPSGGHGVAGDLVSDRRRPSS